VFGIFDLTVSLLHRIASQQASRNTSYSIRMWKVTLK